MLHCILIPTVFSILISLVFSFPFTVDSVALKCRLSRDIHSRYCSVLHCPIRIEILPATPQLPPIMLDTVLVDNRQSHMLPLPVSHIHNTPSHTFPCWVRRAQHRRHLSPNGISVSFKPSRQNVPTGEGDGDADRNDGTRMQHSLLVSFLSVLAIFLLALFVCIYRNFKYMGCLSFYHVLFKWLPCLPNLPHRDSESQSNSQANSQSYYYPLYTAPMVPHAAVRVFYDNDHQQYPGQQRIHSYTEKEINTLLSNATLSEDEAQKLKTTSWICCICLEEDASDPSIARLDCGHATHLQCLRKWLEKGRPVCCLCNAPAISSAASSIRGDEDIDPISLSALSPSADLQQNQNQRGPLPRRRSSMSTSTAALAPSDMSYISRRRSSMSASPGIGARYPTHHARRISSISGSGSASTSGVRIPTSPPTMGQQHAMSSSPTSSAEPPSITIAQPGVQPALEQRSIRISPTLSVGEPSSQAENAAIIQAVTESPSQPSSITPAQAATETPLQPPAFRPVQVVTELVPNVGNGTQNGQGNSTSVNS